MSRTMRVCVPLAVAVVSVLMSSCSKQDDPANTFTLATGVAVTNTTACSETPMHGLTVSKSASDYVVTAAGAFSCGSDIKTPYLSTTRDKKATLVLDSKSKSSCDCFRTVTVRLSQRLEPGDILYVFNDGEVLGHAVMP